MLGFHALGSLRGVFAEKAAEKGCSSMQKSRPTNPNHAQDERIHWCAGDASSVGVQRLKWTEERRERDTRWFSARVCQVLALKRLLMSFLGAEK